MVLIPPKCYGSVMEEVLILIGVIRLLGALGTGTKL